MEGPASARIELLKKTHFASRIGPECSIEMRYGNYRALVGIFPYI
jgi:hypothetical protein